MRISDFYCDTCSFQMPSGFGEYRYIVTDDGERQTLQHPGEALQIRNVLGEDASDELIEERTGYVAFYACRDCAEVFELDREAEKVCPECSSSDVVTEWDLVDESCPKCGDGTFVQETTGVA